MSENESLFSFLQRTGKWQVNQPNAVAAEIPVATVEDTSASA